MLSQATGHLSSLLFWKYSASKENKIMNYKHLQVMGDQSWFDVLIDTQAILALKVLFAARLLGDFPCWPSIYFLASISARTNLLHSTFSNWLKLWIVTMNSVYTFTRKRAHDLTGKVSARQVLAVRNRASSLHTANKIYILKRVSSSDYSKPVVTLHYCHKKYILFALLNNPSELQGEGTSAKCVFLENNINSWAISGVINRNEIQSDEMPRVSTYPKQATYIACSSQIHTLVRVLHDVKVIS